MTSYVLNALDGNQNMCKRILINQIQFEQIKYNSQKPNTTHSPHSKSGGGRAFQELPSNLPGASILHDLGRIMCSRLAEFSRGLILPAVCVAGLCRLRLVWSAAIHQKHHRTIPQELPKCCSGASLELPKMHAGAAHVCTCMMP